MQSGISTHFFLKLLGGNMIIIDNDRSQHPLHLVVKQFKYVIIYNTVQIYIILAIKRKKNIIIRIKLHLFFKFIDKIYLYVHLILIH